MSLRFRSTAAGGAAATGGGAAEDGGERTLLEGGDVVQQWLTAKWRTVLFAMLFALIPLTQVAMDWTFVDRLVDDQSFRVRDRLIVMAVWTGVGLLWALGAISAIRTYKWWRRLPIIYYTSTVLVQLLTLVRLVRWYAKYHDYADDITSTVHRFQFDALMSILLSDMILLLVTVFGSGALWWAAEGLHHKIHQAAQK